MVYTTMNKKISAEAAFCLVGCLHLVTFLSVLLQSPLLYGKNGLQPIAAFLQASAQQMLPVGSSYAKHPLAMLQANPTLLWFHPHLGLTAEGMFTGVCTAGLVTAFAVACGVVHPLLFSALWLLCLSAVGVGQAFLLQPGDAVLLEVTFACIWLSLGLRSNGQQQHLHQHNIEVDQENKHEDAKKQAASGTRQPAMYLLRWLLFKMLLLSSSAKAFVACSGASGLAECYRILVAHGQPHMWTWFQQALPAPLAAAAGALAMLELPAAFLVLCPAAVMQPALVLLLGLQVSRAVLGGNALLHLTAAALCIAALEDSWVASAAHLVRRVVARGQTLQAAEGEEQQQPLARSYSNDSLASLVSIEDVPIPAAEAPKLNISDILNNQTLQAAGGVAVLAAALAVSSSAATSHVLLLKTAQLMAALHYLVPAAAALWFAGWARAAWQSYSQARSAASAAVAELQRRVKAAAEAEAQAKAAAGVPAAGSAARTKPATANGIVPAELPTSPAPLTAIKTKAAAGIAEAPSGSVDAAVAAAAAAAQDEEQHGEGATPRAGGRRRAAAKAAAPSGTPRKGRPAKSTSAATAAEVREDADADDMDEASIPAVKVTKRAALARGKKAAAAAAAAPDEAIAEVHEETEPPVTGAGASAKTPTAAKTPVTATQLHPAAAAAAVATPAAGKAVVPHVPTVGLLERLVPYLGVVNVAAVATAVLFVFVASLPAVLTPAGYVQATLRSNVPGLLHVYRSGRNFGAVSSASAATSAWQATATAAQQLPGSYLAFEFSTSTDGQAWQPVRFRHGFGTAGLGGHHTLPGMLGSLRGVYEPRLQGSLSAAGSGSLEDNMWLLSLADRLLEGNFELAPFLAQPLQAHNWVKIDLVRYSPTSLPAYAQHSGDHRGWLVQHVAEVLPVMPRGDEDLKATLADLGWSADAAAPRSLAATLSAQVTHPGWLLSVLLVLVAARHCLLPQGLIDRVTAQHAQH